MGLAGAMETDKTPRMAISTATLGNDYGNDQNVQSTSLLAASWPVVVTNWIPSVVADEPKSSAWPSDTGHLQARRRGCGSDPSNRLRSEHMPLISISTSSDTCEHGGVDVEVIHRIVCARNMCP